VLRRSSNPAAVNTPPDPISQPADRSIDHSDNIDARFQNPDGFRAPQVGRDLAQFVYPAPGAVQVRQVNGDPVYAALVPVNREFDTPLHPLLQIFVPNDIACSNSEFHGQASCFGNSLF
jgi:hypothetical protein